MKKAILSSILLLLAITSSALSADKELYQHLQDISVTVNSGLGEGSGVLITRDVIVAPGKVEKINFVWTAAHVIDNLRSERRVVENGQTKRVIEFRDAKIIKEHIEDGRTVGESSMYAKVIKYSDSENGEDLAILMVRKKGFVTASAVFYADDTSTPVGTELYHVGSLLGQVGSNSMTRGILSQVGRVLDLGNGEGVVFDQTTVTAFPGSSGGGVFLSERTPDKAGQYVGMLVRGAGETFNFIVPVRRMRTWAKDQKVSWAIDTNAKVPTLKEILSLPTETSSSGKTTGAKSTATKDSIRFPTLPKRTDK